MITKDTAVIVFTVSVQSLQPYQQRVRLAQLMTLLYLRVQKNFLIPNIPLFNLQMLDRRQKSISH